MLLFVKNKSFKTQPEDALKPGLLVQPKFVIIIGFLNTSSHHQTTLDSRSD